jgi:hypothetical protein
VDHHQASAAEGGLRGPARRGPDVTGAEADGLQVVFFRAGGALLAVCAAEVEQAQRECGEPGMMVDLAAEMGGAGERNLLLMIRADGERLGLRVDDVLEVATLPLCDIYALPRLAAARQRGGYVSGIGRRGDELAILLDATALARMVRQERAAGDGATETE